MYRDSINCFEDIINAIIWYAADPVKWARRKEILRFFRAFTKRRTNASYSPEAHFELFFSVLCGARIFVRY